MSDSRAVPAALGAGSGSAPHEDDHYLKRELYERVRTERTIFEFLQAGSLDGVWFWDIERPEHEWMSPRFWELFGYEPTSKKHLASEWQEMIYPEDLQVAIDNFQKHCANPTHPYDQYVRYRHKDGSTVWVRCRGIAIRDASGKPIRMLGAHTDVTALKRMEQELVRAKEAAEAANRELESFSYSVAHDLRAPLRSIDGFSQALLEDYGDKVDEDGRKHLHHVRQSAQLMAQIIDDMLTLSRVTRSELTREKVDLSVLARAAHARLERGEPGRVVDVSIQEGLVANGDPRLLAVVFDNLLGNAWKFTAKRDGARIEFGAASNEGERAYFVRDNGAGFDMTYADKLFGPFQRLHAAHDFEGTGIGLATVQRIVHRHGGRVWAEGKVDAGATFYFTLGMMV